MDNTMMEFEELLQQKHLTDQELLDAAVFVYMDGCIEADWAED